MSTEIKTPYQSEVEVLKSAFKDNEPLLKLMRSLFFGFSLSKAEKETIKKSFANIQLRDAVRKKIYPIMDKDTPIGFEGDFWAGSEKQIQGQHQDSIFQTVMAKKSVLEMFTQALALLEDPYGKQIDFSYEPDNKLDPLQVKLLARSLYYQTIISALTMIKVTVQMKENETPQEAAKRIQADSMK